MIKWTTERREVLKMLNHYHNILLMLSRGPQLFTQLTNTRNKAHILHSIYVEYHITSAKGNRYS